MIKRLLSLALVFVFLLGACLPGICSAAPTEAYPITEAELTRLDQIFQQLSSNNSQLLTQLEQSKMDLTGARQQLEQYQRDLAALQTQLQQSKNDLTTAKLNLTIAQTSLDKANASLRQYEAEVKVEQTKLKIERDIGWIAVVAVAVLKK